MSQAPATARRARVGREAVVDDSGRVVGYELLFHPASGADQHSRDLSTSGVITAAFGQFASNLLGTRRQLYVNAPRVFFTTVRDMPFSPQNVVLQILGDVEVDDDVVDGAISLKMRGFRVAVDGWTTGPAYGRLLPLVDVVKVDLQTVDLDSMAEFVDYVRQLAPIAQVLGDGVQDEATRTMCLGAGFDLLQGPLFHQRAAPASATSVSQLASLRLLAALCDIDSSFTDIERIVSADPGLTLRVLGSANSAAGASREVTSLRQALVLVGRRTLGAWVMLGALNGRADSGREECVDVLTRARTCELLATRLPDLSASSAYAAGLVAGMVSVLGADPEAVVRASNLQDAVADAVLRREGDLGALLSAVEEFDRFGVTSSDVFDTEAVSRAHLHALGAAVETVDSLSGD